MSGKRMSGRSRLEDFQGTDRFEIVSRLGAGGMGVVYEAVDHSTNSRVALKTLTLADPTSIYRFKKEFRGLSDISHPNLVALYELMAGDEQWFFTMELIRGTDLATYLGQKTCAQNEMATERLTEDRRSLESGTPTPAPAWPSADLEVLRAAMLQLAEGLHALHSYGRLHRDIKPNNVLVSEEDRVVLVDFGLSAKAAEVDSISDRMAVGTIAYMSPEQAAQGQLGPASDWYSVGCVLYELLTGRTPFVGRGDSVLVKKQEEEPEDPRALFPELPEELCDLCTALLRRDPAARPTGIDILQRLGATSDEILLPLSAQGSSRGDIFIGRGSHLRRLFGALATVQQEATPQCVLVHGSPGIGKTALLRRFTEQAYHADEAIVLSGRCYERELVPFKAVDTLVDALSRHLGTLSTQEVKELLPKNTNALVRLFPVLKAVRAIARGHGKRQTLDPQVARRLALTSLRDILKRLSRCQTVILRVDDFQWGDADSAVFLSSLLRVSSGPSVLLLVGYRRDDVETSEALQVLLQRLDELAMPERVVSLPLDRLSDEEATELTRARFGRTADSENDTILQRVAAESDGSPFFVEEMMRYLRMIGDIGSGGLDGDVISLRQTMLARFAVLSIEQRKLLDVVAVAGAPLTEEIAFRAGGLSAADGTIVSVLRAGRLVRSNREGIVAKLESYHDRIRELLVEQVAPQQLEEIYRALACAFELCAPAEIESIADFYSRAGDVEVAAEHAIRAADRAMAALAFKRAALYYSMALRADHSAEEAMALNLKLAEALSNAGQGEAAAGAYLEVAKVAPKSVALDQRRKAAESLMRAGHVDRAVELFKNVLASVNLSFSSSNRRAVFNLLFWRAYLSIRGVTFRKRGASELSPDELFKIDVCGSCGWAFGANDLFRGAEFQTRHVVLALRAGEPGRVGIGLSVEAAYRALQGKKGRASAESLIARARELGEELGDPVLRGYTQYSEALAVYQCGEWRQGAEYFNEAALIFKRDCFGHQASACQSERLAADALFFLGEIREFSLRVPSILQAAEERGDLHGATDMRTGLLNCSWLVRGQVEQARIECLRGEKQWSERRFFLQHYYVALAHINIDIYEGEGGKALARCDAMWGALKRSFLLGVSVVGAQASQLQGRALVAAAARENSENRRQLLSRASKVAKKLHRHSLGCAPAWADLLAGQVALLRGDETRALSLLASARTELRAQEMMSFYHACSAVLGRLMENDAGREMLDAAIAWAEEQGVVEPLKFLRICAPLA
ncbi:MAG: protein kinase [Myxococcales bacterium]|nr:protein kinase [Myxococcales bacterium]